MSTFRRVITGHRADGKSIVASDRPVSGIAVPGMPGVELTTLWGADNTLRFPDDGAQPAFHSWFAPPGGFRFIEFIIGPEGAPFPASEDASEDASADAAAVERLFPGLASTMDPDVPGMHRSATIDLLYVVSGRCVLELDDGSTTTLNAGDVGVQSGTMHAWHNPWNEPCRILGVIIGAEMKELALRATPR